MSGFNFNLLQGTGRALAACAVLALCTSSFAAGYKGNVHKPMKIGNKTHLIKQKSSMTTQAAPEMSEEERFAMILKSKNISEDGKTLTDNRDGKKYSIEIKGE